MTGSLHVHVRSIAVGVTEFTIFLFQFRMQHPSHVCVKEWSENS